MTSRYAVIRGTGEPSLDGRWYDLEALHQQYYIPHSGDTGRKSIFERVEGETETREDGAVADVFRPTNKPFPEEG